ncbi:MAG: glycoside hydrolase family 78 protein [Bacteroidales bacterium]|nr:glycoside hydrolase family 78 protein [Bacteroidales bacterium]
MSLFRSVTLMVSSLMVVCAITPAYAQLTPANLRCEHLVEPLGIETNQPLLSWSLRAANPASRNQRQMAWQVLIASSPDLLKINRGDVFDSERVEGDTQSPIVRINTALVPGATYFWKVRTWDQDNKVSPWSVPAKWTMGQPNVEDWKDALWIGQPVNGVTQPDESPSRNAPWLRKTFTLETVPAQVVVHLASFGYHELYINGQRVGDDVLAPAISNLATRVFYRTYDVTKLLRAGRNSVGIWIGHGWSGFTDWLDTGEKGKTIQLQHGPAVKAVLADPKGTLRVTTDKSWKTHPSSFSKTGPWSYFNFGGEAYDARLDIPDWNTAGFDDSAWKPASVVEAGQVTLSPHLVEPNHVVRTFHPVSAKKIGDRQWRVDMGKVYNGWIHIPLTGKAGETVTLRYNDNDNDTIPSNFSQKDVITLSGRTGGDVFENRFNYRSFRWLTINGLEKLPPLEQITAKLIRTNYADAATFTSSNELLNRIYSTVRYTYECLTLGGYIVDCPHRERMGYGAEGQASVECGIYNFDQAAIFRKWLGDWRDVLTKDNVLPNTAPTTWGGGGPAWGLVCATLPWQLYIHYGDKRILEENYDMMTRNLSLLQSHIENDPNKVLPILENEMWSDIGDWITSLDIDPPQDGRPIPFRFRQFFSNCYVIYSLQTASRIAAALDKPADAEKFTQLANDLKKSVHKEFYNPKTGVYADMREQTCYSVPLLIGLPPEDVRPKIEAALERNITMARSGHITTGVLGSYLQYKHLTAAGRDDLICHALLQTEHPSYGYFLSKGLTTIPEAWDSNGTSGSQVHSSYLSVGSWFINGLAGIQVDPETPGFKHFLIRPGATDEDRVEWVKATHSTTYGDISVQWRKQNQVFTLEVVVPPNTTATVRIPSQNADKVSESDKKLSEATGVTVLSPEKNAVMVKVGSGKYKFSVVNQ